MIRLYDTVKVKKSGEKAAIIEIDDNNGMSPPIYLLEIINKPDDASFDDVIFWCEEDDFIPIKDK